MGHGTYGAAASRRCGSFYCFFLFWGFHRAFRSGASRAYRGYGIYFHWTFARTLLAVCPAYNVPGRGVEAILFSYASRF